MILLPTAKKPCVFIGPSKDDLSALPDEVKETMGFAIFMAQSGEKSAAAKPLKGFGGAGVLEVVENFEGDAYRAVYNGQVRRRRLRPTCLPKEIEARQGYASA
jgi:phage-related protein